MHRGKGILLRVSTGFAIEVMTGGFYSVKHPKLALYQTELRPDTNDIIQDRSRKSNIKVSTLFDLGTAILMNYCAHNNQLEVELRSQSGRRLPQQTEQRNDRNQDMEQENSACPNTGCLRS